MNRKYFFLLLAMVCIPVFAEGTPDVTIVKSVTGAIDAAASNLIMPKAILWLSSLMGIQFILTNIGLIKSGADLEACLLYTSPSPRDVEESRMPSSA